MKSTKKYIVGFVGGLFALLLIAAGTIDPAQNQFGWFTSPLGKFVGGTFYGTASGLTNFGTGLKMTNHTYYGIAGANGDPLRIATWGDQDTAYSAMNIAFVHGATAATMTNDFSLGYAYGYGMLFANFDNSTYALFDVAGNFTLSSGSFNGSGSGLTALNGSSISSGTVADARIASTIARRNAANDFTADTNYFAGRSRWDGGTNYLRASTGNAEWWLERNGSSTNVISSGSSFRVYVGATSSGLGTSAFNINSGGSIDWPGTATGNGSGLTGIPPTTGIAGWPANSSGWLHNNGSGTLAWTTPSGTLPADTSTASFLTNSASNVKGWYPASAVGTGGGNGFWPSNSAAATPTVTNFFNGAWSLESGGTYTRLLFGTNALRTIITDDVSEFAKGLWVGTSSSGYFFGKVTSSGFGSLDGDLLFGRGQGTTLDISGNASANSMTVSSIYPLGYTNKAMVANAGGLMVGTNGTGIGALFTGGSTYLKADGTTGTGGGGSGDLPCVGIGFNNVFSGSATSPFFFSPFGGNSVSTDERLCRAVISKNAITLTNFTVTLNYLTVTPETNSYWCVYTNGVESNLGVTVPHFANYTTTVVSSSVGLSVPANCQVSIRSTNNSAALAGAYGAISLQYQ